MSDPKLIGKWAVALGELYRAHGLSDRELETIAGLFQATYEAGVQAGKADDAATERARRHKERLDVSVAEWIKLRSLVFERDEGICQYCGDDARPAHCDHVLPRNRGGRSTLDNLTTACGRCNSAKRDKTPEEWLCQ